MFLEELVEQHRVHLIVTHSVELPFLSRATKSGSTFSTSFAANPNCAVPAGSISLFVTKGDALKP
jgi:hypothetical protein